MRIRALVAAAILITLALPAGSPLPNGDTIEQERHRNHFLTFFPLEARDAAGALHTAEGTTTVTLDEAADRYADHVMDHLGHAKKKERDRGQRADIDQRGGPSGDEPPHPSHAGAFWLLEIADIRDGNPTGACNGGRGGHSMLTLPHKIEGEDRQVEPYVGIAESRVSLHGHGELWDAQNNRQVGDDYQAHIRYGGNSNFFCFEVEIGPIHYVVNAPTVNGYVHPVSA